MRTRLPLSALCLLALLASGGCGDDFLTEDPPDLLTADNLYDSPAGFEAGVNALYAQVRAEKEGQNGGGNGLRTMLWTLGTDNGFGNFTSPDERVLNRFGEQLNPSFGNLLDAWAWLYETVNAANTIVGRAERADLAWSEEERNRVVAEARTIRAWAYRHLTYLWGDVPLVLEESTGSNFRTDWTRTPVADVRAQMEADWLFAEEHLPELTPTAGRLSKAAAQHYLAEHYLTTDRPDEAEAYAKKVTESGHYSLVTERYGVRASEPGTPFTDMFLDGNVRRDQGNTEVLWAIQSELDVPGGDGNILRRYFTMRYDRIKGLQLSEAYGGRGLGRFAPTSWSLDLYGAGDDRGSEFAVREYYLYNDPDGLPEGAELGDTLRTSYSPEREVSDPIGQVSDLLWPWTRKWEYTDPNNLRGGGGFQDIAYLRLAETYLLLAEAHFRQGEMAEAAETLNKLRRRAGASEVAPGEVTLDLILDERSRELLTEEHRRYTLVRTGTWLERTRRYNMTAGPYVTERDALYPIPQAVIDANIGVEMEQNLGY